LRQKHDEVRVLAVVGSGAKRPRTRLVERKMASLPFRRTMLPTNA